MKLPKLFTQPCSREWKVGFEDSVFWQTKTTEGGGRNTAQMSFLSPTVKWLSKLLANNHRFGTINPRLTASEPIGSGDG